ncbi:hypothetical protein ACFVMC_18880 [Nocardia sp. NPDC127579]|uniref:hypothetical protein n=1 Tax=Nocardia sp. NPDC127579 TaxID=3345402 RepID=UPI003640CFA0
MPSGRPGWACGCCGGICRGGPPWRVTRTALGEGGRVALWLEVIVYEGIVSAYVGFDGRSVLLLAVPVTMRENPDVFLALARELRTR